MSRKHGALALKYTVGMFRPIDDERIVKVGQPGVADTLFCWNGRFVAVEVKLNRDEFREEQVKFRDAVIKAGGIHIVARFPGGLEEIDRCLSS